MLECDVHFRILGSHWKDKFCNRCREEGVLVPASRVRAINVEQHATFTNSTSEGLWNESVVNDLPEYRLVNHTQGCKGPRLVSHGVLCSFPALVPARTGWLMLRQLGSTRMPGDLSLVAAAVGHAMGHAPSCMVSSW